MKSRLRILICSLVSLVICMIAGGNRCSNQEEIEFFDPNNLSLFFCPARFDCPDGFELSTKQLVHPFGTSIECIPCPKETFSSLKTNYTCTNCTRCGYNKELSNCTHSQDRQCSTSECVSKYYYLDTTDGQCYQCSECCGSDPNNVQPHCLAASPFSIGITVIGQKGATHCRTKASQKCGYSFDIQRRESGYNKEFSYPKSSQDRQCLSECASKECYLNTTNGQCYQCTECCGSDPNNIQPHCLVSSFSIGITVMGEKGAPHCGIKASQKCGYLVANQGGESSFNILKIIKKIPPAGISGYFFWFFLLLSLGVIVWCCIKRKLSSGESFQSGIDSRGLSSSLAYRRLDSDDMNHCASFQEKLKVIPEGVKIDNLPYAVEEIIWALDGNKGLSKNWYDVGRKLGVPASDLDMVGRENLREGGRPTKVLLSMLGTWENVVSLRTFVQVLRDIGRGEIVRMLFDYYDNGKQIDSENPV